MNDYHSSIDIMPSVDVRKESLKNYANTFFEVNVPKEKFNDILDSIVNSTPVLSACGYWIFGMKQEQEKLSEILIKK